MILSNTKTLDLHGETKDISKILVNEFIDECYLSGEEVAVIIHGIGSGIVKKAVHEVLRTNKKIERFYLDFTNAGQTIVKIKTNI